MAELREGARIKPPFPFLLVLELQVWAFLTLQESGLTPCKVRLSIPVSYLLEISATSCALGEWEVAALLYSACDVRKAIWLLGQFDYP